MGRRRPYGVHMTPSRLLTRPRPSPRRGTERGQASGEFAGILLVAGLLAGSLVVSATTWGEEISDGVICAIQSIGGEGARQRGIGIGTVQGGEQGGEHCGAIRSHGAFPLRMTVTVGKF